jgi:acetylornithine deacetylase
VSRDLNRDLVEFVRSILAQRNKGKIAARATCCGVEGHSALTPKALNAIHLACDFVGFIRQSQEEIIEAGLRDQGYDVPYTALRVGRIEGGAALNIVQGKCTVDLEIRNISRDDGTALLDRLAEGAARIAMKRRSIFPQAEIRVALSQIEACDRMMDRLLDECR